MDRSVAQADLSAEVFAGEKPEFSYSCSLQNEKSQLQTNYLAIPMIGVVALMTISNSAQLFAQTPSHPPPPGMTCPGDKIVWVNTRSHIYHFQGERYFGSTKEGKFICEHDADKEGNRPTHNGQ
jgi:hypothetical protein